MSLIISQSNFTGKFNISSDDYSKDIIDEYIDKYEEKYLIDLLGVDLFKLFKADITDGVPVTQKYIDIFDPFLEVVDDCPLRSEGMIEMLKGFLYFEIVRDLKYKNTVTGVAANSNETTREVTFDEGNIYGRYNDAIANYQAIQRYIIDRDDDYPEFKGICKKLSHWSL